VDIRFYLPSPLGSRVFHSILLSVKRTTALTVNNKDNLKWDKLSPETRRHYESQGWIASEWNNDGNIYDIDWDKIPSEDRKALEELGWTKEAWDSEHVMSTPAQNKSWSKLSFSERSAAEHLGFNKENWFVKSVNE